MIKLEIDTDEVVALVSNTLRQLPYAMNSAITRTAKEAVDAGQKEVAADLQLRKKFILNRIRILQYSKVGNLTAIIGVDTKVQGAPLLLGFLEDGGEKTATRGPDIAIPITGEAARPSFPESVVTSLRYTNLRFENRRGRKKTYLIPGVGIFQRIGGGAAASRALHGGSQSELDNQSVLIYSFKPEAKLSKHIQLREAMLKVIGDRFGPIFDEEFTKEILKRAERV